MPEYVERFREERREINGRLFTFLVECLKRHFAYLCTIDEVAEVLRAVPSDDLEGLDLFVFRQPGGGAEYRKCCWGAYAEAYPYRDAVKPAVLLDAVDDSAQMVAVMPLNRANGQIVECLREEGHRVADVGDRYIVTSTKESVRRTQLYRTVFHLVRHHVDYFRGIRDELDRENRANKYAREMKRKWLADMLNYD